MIGFRSLRSSSGNRRLPLAGVVLAIVLLGGSCAKDNETSTNDTLPKASTTDDTTVNTDDTSTTTTPPVESTSSSSETTAPAPTPSVEPLNLDWKMCNNVQCATFDAPLDYSNLSGPKIQLTAARVPASSNRVGSLFVNFGGPGGTAADTIAGFARYVPAAISSKFDIVGLDPRGVGQSSKLDCGISADELYKVDPTIEDESDKTTLVEVSNAYAENCQSRKGEVLSHLGTSNVARDMDLLRASMGDEKMNLLGYSYGTSIGQEYAKLFPDRVRALILDGVVDTAPSGIDAAKEQAEGFETALKNWATNCPQRPTCAFPDPIAAVEQVIAKSETGIPSSEGTFGPGSMSVALASPLYANSKWDDLDNAISAALNNDANGLVELENDYIDLVDFSIYFAVSCLDSEWPRDTNAFFAAGKEAAQVSPHFGEPIVLDYIRCAMWPAAPKPLGPITAPGTPPILVISTTGDPATPYQNGVDVAERLDNGVLLTYQGEGHTITFFGSSCVDKVVTDYIVDGKAPQSGTTCR